MVRFVIAALLLATTGAFKPLPAPSSGRSSVALASAFHSVTDTDTDGNAVSFADFEGKQVAYCVNVASA